MSKIYWAKVKEEAIIPSKRVEDAGYDMYPCFEEDYIMIKPNETKLIPLGIASAFDADYAMILKERGSTGTKGIAQRCGVIDSGFRGEYQCPITNVGNRDILIIKKEYLDETPKLSESNVTIYPYEKAICQGILLKLPKLESETISYEKLQEMKSERGKGMLGSSGK